MKDVSMTNAEIKWLVGKIVVGIVVLWAIFTSFGIVNPGNRGVVVTLGKVDQEFKTEGLTLKPPFVSSLIELPISQKASELVAESFSKDLQLMKVKVRLLFHFPETNVVKLYQQYGGSSQQIVDSILAPKLQESTKEVTAGRTAESFVKTREEVKGLIVKTMRDKIEGLVIIDDVVIENIDLSTELEKAIEQKMVQEQQAGRAKFAQDQAKIDAETAKIRAQGEADSIRIRSEALAKNPNIINLMIAEKWNGVSPLVVGGGEGGPSVILPINK